MAARVWDAHDAAVDDDGVGVGLEGLGVPTGKVVGETEAVGLPDGDTAGLGVDWVAHAATNTASNARIRGRLSGASDPRFVMPLRTRHPSSCDAKPPVR